MANKIATVTLMHGCRGLKQAFSYQIEISAAVEIIMLASFNPHSPAAKWCVFLSSQMQLTHVTKYKLSRIIGDEGESHKAMGNPTLGCIGTPDIESTIITQIVCAKTSVSISARLYFLVTWSTVESVRVCGVNSA